MVESKNKPVFKKKSILKKGETHAPVPVVAPTSVEKPSQSPVKETQTAVQVEKPQQTTPRIPFSVEEPTNIPIETLAPLKTPQPALTPTSIKNGAPVSIPAPVEQENPNKDINQKLMPPFNAEEPKKQPSEENLKISLLSEDELEAIEKQQK